MKHKKKEKPPVTMEMITAKRRRRDKIRQVIQDIFRVLLIIAALCFTFLNLGQGQGWISNATAGENWPERYITFGWLMIWGTIFLLAGTVLCLLKRDILAMILGTLGAASCVIMTALFASYADESSFYSDILDTEVSTMYYLEAIPTLVAWLSLMVVALLHFTSEEAVQKRRKKKEAEEAPAPPILDEPLDDEDASP